MDQKSILVVDDECHIVTVLALKLKKADFNVRTASNGQEALERIKENVPDLLITDFSMPVMNGLELVKNVRLQEELTDLPIIMLTARGQDAEELESGPSTVQALMAKPFSPREILARVQSLLGIPV